MLPSSNRAESRYSEHFFGEIKSANRDYTHAARKLYLASGLLVFAGVYEQWQGKYLAAGSFYLSAGYLLKQGIQLDKKVKNFLQNTKENFHNRLSFLNHQVKDMLEDHQYLRHRRLV